MLGLIALGTAGRIVWAFASYGVAPDIEALQAVAHSLQSDPTQLYGEANWPYPAGFVPVAGVCDVVADALGIPFHGVVQLPVIAADAAIAYVVASVLLRRTGDERLALAGAALVAASPLFVLISGYHGQIDAFAILPALLGVLVWAHEVPRRALWAGLLIGLAAAIKQPPFLMVLALLPTAVGWRERGTLVAAAASVPLLSVLPFLATEPGLTADGLTANRGVPGFGGLSAVLQPELTRFWATLDGNVSPNSAVETVTDVQNLLVGAAVVAATVILMRRRTAPLDAACVIWLVVFAVNPNFAFQYLIWGLPFFLAAGRVRWAAILTVAASVPAYLLYFRPDIDESGWLYLVLVQALWLGLTVAAVRVLGRERRKELFV